MNSVFIGILLLSATAIKCWSIQEFNIDSDFKIHSKIPEDLHKIQYLYLFRS